MKEKQAKSLKELQIIRAKHKDYLDSINGNLGTALGLKKYTNKSILSSDPAIIVFVPHKIKKKWLPKGTEILDKLETPDGLWCYLDVVEGRIAENDSFVPDSPSEVVERLRGWDNSVWIGSQISININEYDYIMGTIGAFVREKTTKELGLLTNQHVAGEKGTELFFPVPWGIKIAKTMNSIEFVEDEEWYSNVDEENTQVRVDCAFAKISEFIDPTDLKNYFLTKGKLGDVLDISIDNMNIIGRKVMRIGRTTGIRYGTIVAFGYEYRDEEDLTVYTDLLIVGDDNIPFSTNGDSGSLIVTNDDNRNPIALLWGGWTAKLRTGRNQENWTYAICLKRILDRLNLELVT